MDTIPQDLRYAARRLRQSPGFTLVAILTLALGIGANTAVFTLIHAVMLQPLPVPRPEQLYSLGDDQWAGSAGWLLDDSTLYSKDLYESLRDHTPEFSSLAAFQASPAAFSVRRAGASAAAEPYVTEFVSGNYFTMFGLEAHAGRLLSMKDDQPSSAAVAVISYRAWHNRFGADPSLVGSVLAFQGVPLMVIGVAPESFFGDTLRTDPPDFWLPLAAEPALKGSGSLWNHWDQYWLYSIGRIQPGAQPWQIQAHVTAELRHWLYQHYPEERHRQDIGKHYILVKPAGGGVTQIHNAYANALWLLMSVSGLVLLIACANIANLLLARAAASRLQTAVRVSLGATRGRLMQQMLTEGLLLALLGGAAGLWLASAGTQAMLLIAFHGARYVPIHPDPSLPVLLFALLISLLTGIIFSAAPAWFASHSDPVESMRGAGRTTQDHSTVPQQALVSFQAAVSLVLLVGAGLLTESLHHVEHQNFGFDTDGRLIVSMDPPYRRYAPNRLAGFYRQLETRLSQVPGVVSVSFSNYSPMEGSNSNEPISIAGRAKLPKPRDEEWPSEDRVSSHYFTTIGTHLLRGRAIDEHDTPQSQHVAVVNETFAHQYFPSEDALGKHFGIQTASHNRDYEIVGIVEDSKYTDAKVPAYPTFFLPLLQDEKYADPAEDAEQLRMKYAGSIQLHVAGNPESLAPVVRRALADIDPDLTILDIRTFAEQVSRNFNQDRLLARLTSLYGLLALLLASVGLYGVASYKVVRRTSEIGIRVALGADRLMILRTVLRSALSPILLGLVIGIPVALAGGYAIGSQLFGVAGSDPLVLFGAVAVLGACALAAAAIPARRAASIDPVVALRTE